MNKSKKQSTSAFFVVKDSINKAYIKYILVLKVFLVFGKRIEENYIVFL